MGSKKQKLEVKSIKECCEIYFKNYNKDKKFRDAWLAVRKKRYQEITDNGFYLDADAEIFKNEVLKFWEGGWGFRNSEIRKINDGWIPFQDENGETPNSEKIIKNLNNLKLQGNYSWSNLFMGVYHGAITDDMQELKETLHYLFDESIDIAGRFNRAMEITGMGHGKASMFLHIKCPDKLHIKCPDKYGVWNSCTDVAFKIFSEIDLDFKESLNLGGNSIGEKYQRINNGLKYLLKEHGSKKYKNGFENLSDVDIFMWYVSNNFKLIDGKVFFKKLNKKIYV